MTPPIAPIGGYPSHIDVAPTVVFLVLYLLLIPACIYRAASPKTRNVVQLPISAFIVERVLNLTVRLLQATGRWNPSSVALLEYQQIALGWGWIGLAQSLGAFWRSLACNATRPDLDSGRLDDKPMRKAVKAVTYGLDALLWVAQLLGVFAGTYWRLGFTADEPEVFKTRTRAFRLSSTILGISIIFLCVGGLFWCRRRLRTMNSAASNYLFSLYPFLLVIPIYRLTQLSAAPQPKAFFYTFHLAPEFIAAATLICTDTRKLFGTGAWGDAYFSWKKGWRSHPFRRRRPRSQPLVQTAERRWTHLSNASQETYSDETESLIPRSSDEHRPVRRPQDAYPVANRPLDMVRSLERRSKEMWRPVIPKVRLRSEPERLPDPSKCNLVDETESVACFGTLRR